MFYPKATYKGAGRNQASCSFGGHWEPNPDEDTQRNTQMKAIDSKMAKPTAKVQCCPSQTLMDNIEALCELKRATVSNRRKRTAFKPFLFGV